MGKSPLPSNFNKAKEISTRLYYTYHRKSFYLGADLKPLVIIYKKKFPYKPKLTLTLGFVNNPYKGTKYLSRGQRIEWEHIVPVSWFVTVNKRIYDAWFVGNEKCITTNGKKYKGRKCAEKISPLFNKMESDLFNLVPVNGALNAQRNNKPYNIIEGEKREFGDNIDIEISSTAIELPPNKRGDVARIMLYMNKKYGIKFPDHNNTLIMIKKWDKSDPISDWETKKAKILKSTFDIDFNY